MFYGDESNYQNWKTAFMACVDQAQLSINYYSYSVCQCLAGKALKVIENLGHSAAVYQAAMERLERKFGGQSHQIALYLKEIDSF